MKKLLTILALSIFVFAFSSCKKDRTCECSVDGQTESVTYKDVNKKDAKSACEALETLQKLFDPAASCSLK